jgi:hypothetical protein
MAELCAHTLVVFGLVVLGAVGLLGLAVLAISAVAAFPDTELQRQSDQLLLALRREARAGPPTRTALRDPRRPDGSRER